MGQAWLTVRLPLYTSGPSFVEGLAVALMVPRQVGGLPPLALFASEKFVGCHRCMDADPLLRTAIPLHADVGDRGQIWRCRTAAKSGMQAAKRGFS